MVFCTSSEKVLEFVCQARQVQYEKEINLRMRISLEFKLGGLLMLQNPSDEETEILFQCMVGLQVPDEEDVGTMPPQTLNLKVAHS